MIDESATSYKQTKYGILPRSKILKHEVLGVKKGLILLNKFSEENKKITPDLIKKVHKECFSDILVDDAGQFRTVQVAYSGKEAPHFSKMAEMMKMLCDDIEFTISRLPKSTDEKFIDLVVELLTHFQHRFVYIHPFVDYNGRIARMFTSYILMRLNLPIIEIKADKDEERKEYIKALQKADEGDYQSLENIVGKALNESLDKAIKK